MNGFLYDFPGWCLIFIFAFLGPASIKFEREIMKINKCDSQVEWSITKAHLSYILVQKSLTLKTTLNAPSSSKKLREV